MTQAQTQDWVEKVRKLLAVAEDPNTSETVAETYREKAYALMTQFEIEEAQLHDADRVKLENIIRVDWRDIKLGKTYSYELTVLIANVAEAHGMRGLVGKYDVRYPVIIGFEGDVARLRLLVESLLRQCTTAMNRHMREWTSDTNSWYTPTATDKYNQRRSFIIGYGDRLAERIKVARQATVQVADNTTPGTALVLIDKAKQVQNWVDENIMLGKSARRRYDGGMYAGRRAADSADLGQARFGGSRGAIDA